MGWAEEVAYKRRAEARMAMQRTRETYLELQNHSLPSRPTRTIRSMTGVPVFESVAQGQQWDTVRIITPSPILGEPILFLACPPD